MRKFAPLLILLTGCMETTSTAVRNPELSVKPFSKLLVVGNVKSLAYRKQIESGLVELLRQGGASAVPSLSIFLEQPTPDELAPKLAALGVDGVMIFSVDDAHVVSAVVNAGGSTTTSSASCAGYGYGANCSGQSQTQNYGPTVIEKPRMSVTAVLIDVASRKMAWQDQLDGRGGGFVGFEDLINDSLEKVANDMIHEHLLAKAPVTTSL